MSEKIAITKRYGQVISHDYQSWEFMTEVTRTVEVNGPQDVIAASEKLANTVKVLTLADVDKSQDLIHAKEVKK